MKQRIYKLLCLMTALFIMSCECPYLYGESDSEYYRRTGYDRLTADLLPGLWQCYYPMIVGNVEFKEVRMFSNGKADIIMEAIGGSAYYAETFKWRYDGSRLLVFCHQNSICVTLEASTPGLTAEVKNVLNKYSDL